VVLALFACHDCLLSLIVLFSCGLRTLNVGCRRVDPLITHMCASTWTSGRSDPNPEQVFGQAFETLTGLGF